MASAEQPAAESPQAPSNAPSFLPWMVLALASAFLCQGWLTGIPAFVLITLARGDWLRGAHEASLGKMKLAKVLTIAGILIGVCLVGYIIIAVSLHASLPPPSY